ncbi:hypothetical protein H2O64_18025 [Kordia sp. YSTF-M3]|uniref:Uncharacterized protein n=1 Tax=Kordia aestuariivivens TaxID=2759037 RepID=A0ABR7QDG1_9FLAO|nr:hypothetical protein [Kordia aestuariivivens]MBC8756575.1 hypothetical protein [Kordia aestuariivivens]
MNCLFIVFFGLFATFSFSQEVKTQKEILGIPNTDLVTDFNLKIGKGAVIPKLINEKQFDQRKKRGSQEISTTLERTKVWNFDTENKRITSNSIIYRDQTSTERYFYNQQESLLTYNYKSPTFKYTNTFTYDANGTFRYIKIYEGKSNSSKQTFKKTDYGYISSGLIFQKFYLNKKLVDKIVTNYNSNEPSETIYTYDAKNQLVTSESAFGITNYTYNSNGEVETFVETSKNTNTVTKRNYVYLYDKYGNWTISLSLLDLSYAKKIQSFPNPRLRKITYSNGEVTGTTNIDDVTTELISLRAKIRQSANTSLSGAATWKKVDADNFTFFIGNQRVTTGKNARMGDHLLFYSANTNELFLLENFESQPINSIIEAKKMTVATENGFWYRIPKGGVHVFLNDGTYISKTQVFEYTSNNKDVFFKGEKHPEKVVLTNYRTAKSYTVYPVTLLRDYTNTSSGNMTDSAQQLANSLDEYSEYFTGECVKGDCKDGYGEKEFKDGKTASGFFKDGKVYGPMHTAGKNDKKSSFSVFKGSFLDQEGFAYEYNGDNLMIFTDKSKNIGFYNDSKTKKTYQLNYRNGEVISKKELQYNNSKTCVVGNCSNGVGIYEYGNSTYLGTFKNGKRNGFGMLYFKSGGDYIGEFYNGNYHGLGTYTRSEYDYYMGYYQNGKQHGQGVQYFTKDSYNAGNWVNGKFQSTATTTSTSSSNSTSTSSSTSNSASSSNTTAVTSFSDEQKNGILACKNDAKCVKEYFNSLYTRESKNLSGAALTQKMTDYFHSLHTMNPKLAFDILFKIDISIIDLKSLPQAVQSDLKARAQKISDGYQEHKRKQGN